MKNMLSEALCKIRGLLNQLLVNLEGENGVEWLSELKKFLRKEKCWMERILKINRSKPFNPAQFIGKGWKIEEEDEKFLVLEEIDLANVRLVTCLKSGESLVGGEEKLKRLKKDKYTRLDAKVFQTLWENQHLIPENWKEKTDGKITYIFFDGTVLRNPDSYRYVLYLYWNDGGWNWDCDWLDGDWCVDGPSAVFASPQD